MDKKDLENWSIEELRIEWSRIYKELNVQPRKVKVDENGTILLDQNDKNDWEWYENDEAYEGMIEIKDSKNS